MYNFNLLKKARESFCKGAIPFLDEHRSRVQAEKPYQALTILHNVPLTLITVFKIEVLALGGAQITVTAPQSIPFEKRAVDLLKEANFEVQIEQVPPQSFDFHLDCCADLLAHSSPTLGAVELTQSGSKLYQAATLSYPAISVDDSKLKVLETFFGTGDGFYRALQKQFGDNFKNKPFVVFGYGKVGRGIVYALKQISNDITVIDLLSDDVPQNPPVRYIDARDKASIKKVINQSFCTITATGIKHLLSNYYAFEKADFGDSILANMGADDEYGPNFTNDEVLFDKKPFNFSLIEPTAFHYLDPIFYAHNFGIDLILSKQVDPGYHPFPLIHEHRILDKWQAIYQEDMTEALQS